MKTKRKGTRNEHRTMALLEAAGYSCTRSGDSLGVFDVVGIGTTDVVLVQVKTRDWPRHSRGGAVANVFLSSELPKVDSSLERPRAVAGHKGIVREPMTPIANETNDSRTTADCATLPMRSNSAAWWLGFVALALRAESKQ